MILETKIWVLGVLIAIEMSSGSFEPTELGNIYMCIAYIVYIHKNRHVFICIHTYIHTQINEQMHLHLRILEMFENPGSR